MMLLLRLALLMAAPSLIATTNTCNAFSVTNVQNRNGVASSTTTSLQMAEATASDVKMVPSNGSPEEMDLAASFMVDAFWLNSPQGLCLSGDAAPDGAMLLQEQAHDFNEKYGEIMGSRVLNTMLIQAMGENSALLGLVGIEVSLLDKTVGDIVSATKSQDLLKMAVASLGPKERRTYKKATVQEICTELLPPHLEAVVVLSNLVVSPQARRRGIAKQLCQEAERMAGSWGYDALYLRVEAGNEAARTLYEKLLGFDTKYELPEAIGIRIDDGGKFVEVDAPTLVLSKSL